MTAPGFEEGGAAICRYTGCTYDEWVRRYRAIEEERDELAAKVERYERALDFIASTDPVDAALDPDRAIRVARVARKESQGA